MVSVLLLTSCQSPPAPLPPLIRTLPVSTNPEASQGFKPETSEWSDTDMQPKLWPIRYSWDETHMPVEEVRKAVRQTFRGYFRFLEEPITQPEVSYYLVGDFNGDGARDLAVSVVFPAIDINQDGLKIPGVQLSSGDNQPVPFTALDLGDHGIEEPINDFRGYYLTRANQNAPFLAIIHGRHDGDWKKVSSKNKFIFLTFATDLEFQLRLHHRPLQSKENRKIAYPKGDSIAIYDQHYDDSVELGYDWDGLYWDGKTYRWVHYLKGEFSKPHTN